MSDPFPGECASLLRRTPAVLDALLRDVSEVWIRATEGPGTWSPYAVLGHLIHTEKVDWMPRLRLILEHGLSRPFDPLDREAMLREDQQRPVAEMLDEFASLRQRNLAEIEKLDLQPAQLRLQGAHPALGPVTVRQLLATWTAHDQAHILQIARTMAWRLKDDVGPFSEFLSVMK